MFDAQTNRYVTRGINEELPYDIQVLLWRLIDKTKKEGYELDYLQIFEINQGNNGTFEIMHRQEEPEFKHEYVYSSGKLLVTKSKVWVIDSGEYQTMLFPREY